jgi:sulfur carrier protein
MKVIIRNPRRREFELEGSRRVDALLRELDLNPEQVLVVRNDDLLTRDVVVRNDDTVEIVTAISGGIGLGRDGAGAVGIQGVQ